MAAKRTSIAQAMMVVALVAMNLAMMRGCPTGMIMYPTFWVFLGVLDFLLFWKLVLKRPLRAFHYTFLIVIVVAWIVLANLVATERFHPLGLLIRWYQQLAGENQQIISLGYLHIGEFWMACFLSFTFAFMLGVVAAWFERRRNWDIAAFFRGALVGFGVANLWALIDGAVWGWVVESQARMIGRLVLLGVCVILGGMVGLSRLRSSTPGFGHNVE